MVGDEKWHDFVEYWKVTVSEDLKNLKQKFDLECAILVVLHVIMEYSKGWDVSPF